VVGAHLPRLDPKAIAAFIAGDVAEFVRTMQDLRQRGITKTTEAEIEARAQELPAELDADLQTCALFEVEVIGNETAFDPADFENPDTGYCGWEPAFLSIDGESILFEGYRTPTDLRASKDWCTRPGNYFFPHLLQCPRDYGNWRPTHASIDGL